MNILSFVLLIAASLVASETELIPCKGDYFKYNGGYGGCQTYTHPKNYRYCDHDVTRDKSAGSHGFVASVVCPECLRCALVAPCDAATDCNGQGTTTDLDNSDGCVCVCNGGFSGADCSTPPRSYSYTLTPMHHCGGRSIKTWQSGGSANYGKMSGINACKNECNKHSDCLAFVEKNSDNRCGFWKSAPLAMSGYWTGYNCYAKGALLSADELAVGTPEVEDYGMWIRFAVIGVIGVVAGYTVYNLRKEQDAKRYLLEEEIEL